MSVRILGKSVAHYVDEFDLSGVSNSAEIEASESPAEVTAFADTDATFVEGKYTFRFNIQGLLSSASPNYDGEMFIDLTSSQRRVGVYPGGGTAGNFGYEGRSNITRAPRVVDKGAVLALNVEWLGDQPLVRSQLMYLATAVSATVNGTKYQHGSVAAAETLVGVIRLLAAPGGAGSNDLVVTIQSDADSIAGGETTRLTFATINQASVALHEVVELAGAVTDTWWRAVVTITGAGTRTFSIVVAIGTRAT